MFPSRNQKSQSAVGILLALTMILGACTSEPAATTELTPAPPTPASAAGEVGPTQAPPEGPPGWLFANSWTLIGYADAANPTVVQPGVVTNIQFLPDGNLSGTGGCNSFNTTYQINGDQISFGPAASTLMACQVGMEQEAMFFAALETAQNYQLSDRGRLLIGYDSGAGFPEVLVFDAGDPPLQGPTWVLQSFGDPQNPTKTPRGSLMTATFGPDGQVSGLADCNTYNAGFSINENQIQIQPIVSTEMVCPQGVENENAYLTALQEANSYHILDGKLTVTYANGAAALVYTSKHLALEINLWVLAVINDTPISPSVRATALFDPPSGAVSGSAGCNNYNASYTKTSQALTISPASLTAQACDEAIMEVEDSFMATLQSATTFQTLGENLILQSEAEKLIFHADRKPLVGTLWHLESMGPLAAPAAPVVGANFTASFARLPGSPAGGLSGQTGCNEYSANYYANLEEIKVNVPQQTGNTNCPAGLPEQEQEFFKALNIARSYRILGDRLQVFYNDQVLNFSTITPTAPPPAQGGVLAPLHNTNWWLESINALQIVPGSQVTATFQINPDGLTGMMNGLAGCNTYSTEILGVFRVGPAVTTQKTCVAPPGIMEQENAYLAALQSASTIAWDFGVLTITTEQGNLVYKDQPPLIAVPPIELTPQVTIETPTETPEATTSPAAPVAVITAPLEGNVDETIDFDASASSSSAEIVSYQWDFGDGNTAEGVAAPHAYSLTGQFTVTLTITDANGQQATTTIVITIN